MQWDDSLSIGVEQLDVQHKRLVEILNTLHEAMLRGSQKQDLEQVMADLLSFTRYHFSFEEKLMVVAAYPGLAEQQREHEAMVAKVAEFAQQVAEGRTLVSIKLLDFLKRWLRKHIGGTDRRFGDFEVARKAG